jgi:hypothetical protein
VAHTAHTAHTIMRRWALQVPRPTPLASHGMVRHRQLGWMGVLPLRVNDVQALKLPIWDPDPTDPGVDAPLTVDAEMRQDNLTSLRVVHRLISRTFGWRHDTLSNAGLFPSTRLDALSTQSSSVPRQHTPRLVDKGPTQLDRPL